MAETTTKTPSKKTETKTTAAGTGTKPEAKKRTVSNPAADDVKPALVKKPTVAKKPAAAKPEAEAKPAAKNPGKEVTITGEQRYRMVAEAAYYRAESHQFMSDPLRDWIEAENDIAALLSVRK
jgi:hypothetical protein